MLAPDAEPSVTRKRQGHRAHKDNQGAFSRRPFVYSIVFFRGGEMCGEGEGGETISNWLNYAARVEGGFRSLPKLALHEEQRRLRASVFSSGCAC